MVNLEDTDAILPLGALFLAGRSSKGRQFTGGEGGKQYLAGGFAASSSDWAVEQLRSAANLDSEQVPDALAQSLIGAGLSKWGGMVPQNKAMARGIHYNVAADSFGQMGLTLGDMVGDVTDGNGGESGMNSMAATQTVTPNNRSRTDNSVVY